MKQLKCELCGSVELIKQDGVFVCQSCGCKYSVEDAKKMMFEGTVEVAGTVKTKETDFVIRGGVLEKYNGENTEVVVPDNVVVIGESAFGKCKGITSITIPISVREIGDGAFSGCESLKKITIPDSVTVLGMRAFGYCRSLEQITLSKNIESILRETFICCCALKELILPMGVTYVGDDAFYGCSRIQKIEFPNSITKMNFEEFNGLFCGCTNLSDVKIPRQFEDEFIRLAFRLRGGLYDIPWGRKKVEDARKLRNAKRCQYCGGDFKGIFNKICTKCYRSKDY